MRTFDLMKSSIKEMADCHAIFNGLVEGIEKCVCLLIHDKHE